jgi:hypothetical protein
MDSSIRELALLCVLAAFCAGAAWSHDQGHFAAVFAAACALAGIEAFRRLRQPPLQIATTQPMQKPRHD